MRIPLPTALLPAALLSATLLPAQATAQPAAQAAHGADTLPRHLAGTWGTAETLFDGTDEQLFVFLAGDGAAAVIGSGRAPAAGPPDAAQAIDIVRKHRPQT